MNGKRLLTVAIGVAIITVSLLLFWQRDSAANLHAALAETPFEPDIVPSPFEFEEVHSTSSGLIYASFDGPPDRARVAYQVFGTPHEARNFLMSVREAAIEEQRLAGGDGPEAFCTSYDRLAVFGSKPRTLLECWSYIEEVSVRADTIEAQGRRAKGMEYVPPLLNAGLAHLRAVRESGG